MGEFNEQLIPTSYLRQDVDYIALGHFHEFTKVTDNACYAGSIERLSFAESTHEKGFVIVDLGRHRSDLRRLHCRPMLDLSPIDAKGIDAGRLMSQIREKLEGADLADAIVRLNVENISGAQYRSLDHNSIRAWASPAMHFDARFDMSPEDVSVQSHDIALTALDQEFISFLDRYPVEGTSKDAVREKGLEYIRRGLEGSE
jgi:DNA repair exonuclease SbcCD nuclease subunit